MPLRLQKRWIWDGEETAFYESKLVGLTLHVCSGASKLGDVRTDLHEPSDLVADYRHLPIRSKCFETVICDPPWAKRERLDKGISNWLYELRRVARNRIIIIHKNIFKIKYWQLVKSWAVKAKGILYKECSIYEPEYALNPMKKPRPNKGTKAICKTCGKEMMRNQVVRHNWKEHPEAIKANRESMAEHGGLGLEGHQWWQLADPLPGDVI